jgi:riboflavin transporter FmnP
MSEDNEGFLVCGTCGTSNSSKSKFCKKCGARLIDLEKCPQCGNSLNKDSEFCQECGYKLNKQPMSLPVSAGIRKLPLGLEILIALGLLGAAYLLFSSMMGFYTSSLASSYGYSIAGDLALAGFLWAFIGLYLLLVSWGLWKLKEWSRKLVMFQAILGIVVVFLEPIPGLASLIYGIIILWYINQPTIKGLFQTTQVVSNADYGHIPTGKTGKTGSMQQLFPQLDKRTVAATIAFVIVSFVLLGFRIPALYVGGYGYITFWIIPAIAAFLILGPVLGVVVAFLSPFLANFLMGFSMRSTLFDFLEVAVLFAGIYTAQKLISRGTPGPTKTGTRLIAYSTLLGVILSIAILVPLNYAIIRSEGYSIYYWGWSLSDQILWQAIVALYSILLGYLIAWKFKKNT